MKINVKGLEINYTCQGEGDVIVLLHGWGANITLFNHLITLLIKKYKVIALDMPGFGESNEPPEPWGVDEYVDFVIEFLKQFDVKKAMFLGHSFGGRVIIKLVNRNNLPFEADKLMLVDSAGIKPKKTTKQKFKQRVYKLSRGFLSMGIIKKIFPDAVGNLRKKNGSADYNAASEMMRKCLVKVVNEDLTDLLPNIKQNTLIVWGKNDTATPLSDAQLMEKLIPESGLVALDNAGHYSFLDQQFIFEKVIASFLNIKE